MKNKSFIMTLLMTITLVIISFSCISIATNYTSLDPDTNVKLADVYIFADEYGDCTIEIDPVNGGLIKEKFKEDTNVNLCVKYYINVAHNGLYLAKVNFTYLTFTVNVQKLINHTTGGNYEIIEGWVNDTHEYKKGDITECYVKIWAYLLRYPLDQEWAKSCDVMLIFGPKSKINVITDIFPIEIQERMQNIEIINVFEKLQSKISLFQREINQLQHTSIGSIISR